MSALIDYATIYVISNESIKIKLQLHSFVDKKFDRKHIQMG